MYGTIRNRDRISRGKWKDITNWKFNGKRKVNILDKYKTIRVKPITLEYLTEYYCTNCQNYYGKTHNFKSKRCKRCIEHVEDSQMVGHMDIKYWD